jgi:hypothetical protein
MRNITPLYPRHTNPATPTHLSAPMRMRTLILNSTFSRQHNTKESGNSQVKSAELHGGSSVRACFRRRASASASASTAVRGTYFTACSSREAEASDLAREWSWNCGSRRADADEAANALLFYVSGNLRQSDWSYDAP